ncbi:serine/arginine repetitive matrix protein 1 isoform X2 [Gadus morhua]|uniref:serine/arginine repetitive matrix protein 1 isoform X2 n=1 Tax=Gadus morhua TaxID=8049 RepID=UPI0011B4684C|nr:serine/arginine repetitive matrix protein 1-like isoform X2 [Gadus morhua]
MVRPQFGPPRFKSRSYDNDPPFEPREDHFSRRDGPDYTGKAPRSWRGSRGGRGRPPFTKRTPLMAERREPAHGGWRPPHQDSFQSSYSHQDEPHHGHRRPSPSRPNRPLDAQHRPAPHSPPHASPGHRGPSYREGHSDGGHRSPSPWHFNKSPADRRPGSSGPYRGSFRGPNRHPGAPHGEQRNPDHRGHYSPRERPSDHQAHGSKRWGGDREFSHQHNGEYGPPSPQRKPREFQRRNSYPERWSGEQDPRRPRGEVEREGNRPLMDKPQQSHSHPPPYRSPAWKGTPPPPSASSFHSSPRERPGMVLPRKRRLPDLNEPFAGGPPERGPFRLAQTGRPGLLPPPIRFSCSRKRSFPPVRPMFMNPPATGPATPLLPPSMKPTKTKATKPEVKSSSSILASRKERFQADAAPLRNLELRRIKPPKESPSKEESRASKSPKGSDTESEQVESRRSVSTRSCSPPDKPLPSDLVVVSLWQAGSSAKDCSPPRDESPHSSHDLTCETEVPPVKRFSKFHGSRPSLVERTYVDKRPIRPLDAALESNRYDRSFKKPGQVPSQRPFANGPRRMAPPDQPFNVRKPLMVCSHSESFVPQPFPQHRPAFRKSQSIRSKYRNMQVMRHRGPSQQRW